MQDIEREEESEEMNISRLCLYGNAMQFQKIFTLFIVFISSIKYPAERLLIARSPAHS